VAKSTPDGYTLLIGTNTTNAVIQMLVKNVPYDPERDFAPISFLGELPQVVTVNNSLPVKTTAELITYARANPGKVTYAWSNSAQRVSSETLASMAGVDLFNVPYKSSPQAMLDTISGEVNMYISDMIVAMPHIKSGRIRALAVTSSARSSTMPELPTVAESGPLPGYEILGLFALFAPTGTPAEIVAKLNDAVRKASASPDLRTRLGALGLEVLPSTPAELGARMRMEKQRWTKVAKQAGIEPQ
jgi:tripartite-type tricarboxylate transporter receptor subunit TctC